jgi:putative ATP-dependent endonuclease of OLD family
MKITELKITNFRMLENTPIVLDGTITLVVGRNNSGKTSLTEIFCKFFAEDGSSFRFEDFPINTYPMFVKSLELFNEYQAAKDVKESEEKLLEKEIAYKSLIPTIGLDLLIHYEENDNLSSLSNLIMNLDPDSRDALIKFEYTVMEPARLFKDFKANEEQFKKNFLEYLRKKFRSHYKIKSYAVDPKDFSNKIEIEKRSLVEDVFTTEFIYAQRHLDDQGTDNRKKLSKGFEDFYKLNKKLQEGGVKNIEEALHVVSENLDGNYKILFKSIFDDLKNFGVEAGVNLQELTIRSIFEAEEILKGNTQLFYQHGSDLLPEAHNGLGYSNLIFIILQFIAFYEKYDKRIPRPEIQLLFVEEPEAHLHPQMQYVFIKNIQEFIRSKENWNAQVIITTHSSHMIAESGFEHIRYFDSSSMAMVVKNLSDFKMDMDKRDPESMRFLKQYMSLNNCDMFFADKIILVEGTVERLLLPQIIKREHVGLMSKYISIIEVGGAYAHIFKDILNFISVKTLIITDIDSVSVSSKKCKVVEGEKTSNAMLRKWLPKKDKILELIQCVEAEKIEGKIRVTYQTPESGNDLKSCGRSFEDAFIIKNADLLPSCSGPILSTFKGQTPENILKNSYDLAGELKDKKTDFAFDIMLLPNWVSPKYISEGLIWLEKD